MPAPGGRLIADDELPNYYKVLDIDNTASFKDVKVAYKKLADRYHPDKVGKESEDEKAEREERMKLINEAKDTLTDPVKRSKYDQKMGIDIYKDLRKLASFRTEASVSRVESTGENLFNGGSYDGYGYDRDGGGFGRPPGERYNPNYYNGTTQYAQNGFQQTQGNYGAGSDRYYYTGQRYQPNQAEKQTYLCPYCNKKFRMTPPSDIMITSCPTCKNDITIYPE